MKRKYYILLVLIVSIFIICIFFNSKIINSTVIFSINLFVNNVFPSLFTMFIISDLLFNIGIPNLIGNFFSKIFRNLFYVNEKTSFVFFMSLIAGFPSSSKYTKDLLDNTLINIGDANKIIKFTFFANPLFIINTIGIGFFKSFKIGIYFFISNIIGNIFVGVLFRENNGSIKGCYKKERILDNINNCNVFNILFKSIKNDMIIMLSIFGNITFVLIVLNSIKSSFHISGFLDIIITGVFEMTSGIKLLIDGSYPLFIKYILTMFFISFGGISIHMQMFSILDNKKVKYLPFLLSRVIHSLISIGILLFFIYLL